MSLHLKLEVFMEFNKSNHVKSHKNIFYNNLYLNHNIFSFENKGRGLKQYSFPWIIYNIYIQVLEKRLIKQNDYYQSIVYILYPSMWLYNVNIIIIFF